MINEFSKTFYNNKCYNKLMINHLSHNYRHLYDNKTIIINNNNKKIL